MKNGNGKAKKKPSSRSRRPKVDLSKDLWISPTLNLRGRNGDRAWDRSGNLLPGAGARFLELADIALGTRKPAGQEKKATQTITRDTTKEEPYLVEARPKPAVGTGPSANGASGSLTFRSQSIQVEGLQNR